ncbi:MAG: SDR family NAD(P)-dependent oxidoreductase [Bacteroidales bacterium]|jgi:NADP-dependent 3-hydroxy acid dehydrogenase YdfG|nr:SDR family NAD(P)-dependent oxidoreductase [Bacteroidales bacterium]
MKTVLITGATAGFGKAIALKLSKYNYQLILNGRSLEKLSPVIEEIKVGSKTPVYPLVFDVRAYEEAEKAITTLPSAFKNVEILINNAGLALELDTVDQANKDDWNTMIDTNIKGVLFLTRLISPQMVFRKSGHIINIGSISSHEVYKGGSVYCATKHALLALTKGMRSDLLEYGIKVTQISPGAAETNFSLTRFHGNSERAEQVYQGFTALDAEDIAEAVEFVLNRPAHVNIDEILLTPTAQFNGVIIRK